MKKKINRALSIILTLAMILPLSRSALTENGTVFMPGVYASLKASSAAEAGAFVKTFDPARKASVSDETSIDVIEEDMDQDPYQDTEQDIDEDIVIEEDGFDTVEEIQEDDISVSEDAGMEEQDSPAGNAADSGKSGKSGKTGGKSSDDSAKGSDSSSGDSVKGSDSSSKDEEYDGDIVLGDEGAAGNDAEFFFLDDSESGAAEEDENTGKDAEETMGEEQDSEEAAQEASESSKASEDDKDTGVIEDDDATGTEPGSETEGVVEDTDDDHSGDVDNPGTEGKKDTEKEDTESSDSSKKEGVQEDSGSEGGNAASGESSEDKEGQKASQKPKEDGEGVISEDAAETSAGAAAAAGDAAVELRTITAEVVEAWPYVSGSGGIDEQEADIADTFERAGSFWQALFDRLPVPSADREGYKELGKEDLTVQISGMLPEGTTAVVYAAPFAEDATWSETALMGLDLVLYDRESKIYVPETGLELVLGGNIIKKTVKAQKPVLIYNYEENAGRAGKKKTYAADVTVYRDGASSDDRIRYRKGGKKDSGKSKWTRGGIVFTEDGNGLVTNTDNTVGIAASAAGSSKAGWNGPLHLLVSAQEKDRTLSARDGDTKVKVRGALSKTTKASISLDSYQDPSSGSKSGRQGSDKSGTEKLLAVDITLDEKEAGQYDPDLPVTVTITDPAIREALEAGSRIEVYRAADSAGWTQDTVNDEVAAEEDGTETASESARNSADSASGLEKIEFTDIDGSSVQFEAQGPLSYIIKIITVSKKLTASDGREYRITVSYDTGSGIPENAQLDVREIKEGEEGYEDYVAKSAEAVGTASEDLIFARAFDISLTDPKTGEKYQPAEDVKVSIQLLNQEISKGGEISVVHFEEKEGQSKKAKKDTASPRVMASSVKGETVEFETNGFSVYVFLGTVLRQTLTASDGNEYLVTVTYDNTSGIPSDAELYVSEIKEGEAGYEEYVARSAAALGEKPENLAFARPFDITLKNPRTGEEYQPNKDVKVTIELLKDDLNSYASVDVIHIPDEAGREAEVMDSTVHGETVEFETDGFSVYVLIGSGGETVTPQCTYTFWIPNEDVPGTYKEYSFKDSQGHTIYNQTVSSGEDLIVPQITSTDEKTFAGWYKGDTTGGTLTLETEPYDFDNITITENSAIDLYAVYKNYATVTFHDKYDSDSNTFPVVYTRRAELVTTGEGAEAVTNATVKIDDLSIANTSVGGKNMAFYGWSETPITIPGATKDDEGNNVTAVVPNAEGCIQVTGAKDFYPIFIETHLLTFYAAPSGQGAAYNGPRYVNSGDSLDSLPTTSLSGFTFTGWFTGDIKEGVSNPKPGEDVDYGKQISNANGTLIVGADDAGVYVSDGKLYLRADTTLYAGWTDDTSAGYRILYWQQNGTGSGYTYVESASRTGTVGETVSVADADKANDRYDGFHLKEEPASAEVKADGSTVLNVYYDHNDGYVPTAGTYTLTFADSVTEEGKVSPNLSPAQTKSVEAGTILAGQAIENPASGRKGYKFSKWFLDPYGNEEAKLDSLAMPDHDLTLYAGWEVEWYVVSIDPNYGELRPLNDQGVPTGTGSTWFWQTIEREPIAEYTYVERNYVASSSGTFYYVYHPGDGQGSTVWPDRYTYYTTDISKATEDTTFEYSPGTYTYVGWYEVLDDGTEVPYVFGERTDHNTNLKLHWKKNGVYYLKYNAVVGGLEGTMDDADASAELFANGIFADYAEITLTHSAIAPNGYTFVGWKVRGSDSSVVYTPGQVFTLHADDAKRISGKDVVYLDAVYARVGTASIVYNANGGTVAENNVDFGKVPGSDANSWNNASGTVDTTSGTATVSGLANNSKFKLSDGTGFTAPTGSGATFLGWSDKAVCDDSATFFSKDSNVIYGVSESTTLYAVWGAQVTYNLNSENAEWGTDWDTGIYTLTGDVYSQTANLGTVVSEPTNVPVYTGADGKLFRYWATRTGSGTEESPYVYTEYDFSQPITGALDLYAYWSEANTVAVHAVDASNAVLADMTGEDGWAVTNVIVSATETELTATSHVTTVPENYEFAFVAVASDLNSISESNAVTAIKYENKKVLVKYKYESSFRVLGEGKELFFVYYQKRALDIGYKSMEADGVLTDVTTTEGTPANTASLLGEYSMSSQLTAPLSHVTGFTNYAFAVGDVDPRGETPMNASNLSLITNAVGEAGPVPTLRVRNTWRGFEYTTETGENAVWTSCGYTPQLYVVYYTQQPTVVMFEEKTVGTSAVMNTEFTYNLLVTQTTTTTTSVQTQTKDGDNWVNSGDPVVTETTSTPTTIFDTTASGNRPYILKNGEANSSILFYNSSVQIGEPIEVDASTQTVTTTTTVTAQTAVITQTLQDAFTTSINVDGSEYADSQNVYTFTATGSGETKNVTFTNTHKALPVEVHVAMVEGDGTSSGIVQRDETYRSTAETAYKFNLTLGESVILLEKLPAVAYETTEGEGDEAHQVSHEGVFTGDSDSYAFGSVAWGTGTEGNSVAVNNMGAVSIAYAQISDNVYELVLKDSEGNTISELGSNQLYYLYYPMPKIRYVKEATDGTLTDITGCLINQTTGNIEASESVTYGHQTLTMNGKTVAQNQSFEIPLSGFVISQDGNNFRMPPVLDDGLYERYLGYVKIGAGSGTASNSSNLDVSTGLNMQLKVQNNTLQYSFDGSTWKDLPLSGTPTVYAIYSERGYDLQISKTVDMSQSGEDPLFSGASFTVIISSTGITKSSYDAEGADSATVTATPAEGTTPGTITLTVVDGTKVRIKGLGRGEYTITESGNENYTLTARTGSIIGSTTTPMAVTGNTTVSFTLDAEKKVDLTNSPKAICKIDDHYFYTLRSMVAYVDENIATKTATAEMLTDYLMPAADTVEIPSDFNLSLTTAESVGHVAVITRTTDLAGVPLFTSNGALTLTNLTLEGSSIEATAPMIRSAGNLVIGSGAMIQNCVGGGAINATAGNITVSGTIQNCSAAEGGAIYHSGNGTITLNGTGAIQNNTAASGNGGAIWLAGGMVKVSGTSKITGNKAESGNGGAIYANSIVEIEIDQGGVITANTAKEGGAIYANATATISISETENVTVKPAVTGNTATTGNGGAIYVNGGSVSVSGGSISGNKAENGQGGAVYSNNASITGSGTAEVNNNTAKEGGAVYTVSGPVTISGGKVDNNAASTGSGGAVYAGSGNVSVSGGSLSGNSSAAGGGGAVYAGSGNVSVSGGSLSNNTANTDGGAVFAGSGNITVSVPDGGTAATIQSNTATTGKGGALYANTGVVSITGTTLSKNTAGSDGGAVYAGSGAVTLTNSIFGGDTASDSNTAAGNGGAVYAGSGNVTVSGGSMKNNKSTGGNGGALYAGSGTVTVSGYTANEVTTYTQLVSNSASAGKGGAVYLDSGSLTLTSVTATGNIAINGAAIFTNTGRASFSGGSYTGNIASNGGAVGVGGTDARLVFSGTVQIKDNTLGTGDGAKTCNVYLDQDDEAIINAEGFNDASNIGIYVPDRYTSPEDPSTEYLFKNRGGIGGKFGICASDATALPGFKNDREENLSAVVDSITKRVYWSSKLKVEVRYLGSFSSELPTGSNGTKTYGNDNYFPAFSGGAVSLLADELRGKWTTTPSGMTAPVYAMAFLQGNVNVDSYLTKLLWKDGAWWYENRAGSQVKLDTSKKIYIYYSEAAFLSIENNTSFPATLDSLSVYLAGQNRSLFNSSTLTGLGLIYAWNGSIQEELLPVQVNDDGKVVLAKDGGAITIMVPGGQNASYTLDGVFTGGSGSINLRLNGVEQTALDATESFHISGTTRNDAKTYEIIFGSDRIICKVVCPEPDDISEEDYVKKSEAPDAEGKYEYCFAKMRDAVAFAAKYKQTNVTIEMLVDYLMPGTDTAVIADPTGHHFKTVELKTAVTGEFQYPGTGDKRRATISRGVGNESPLIDVTGNVGTSGNDTETYLYIHDINFDGKNLTGKCEGGALATKDCKVNIKDVSFINCNSYNGGAVYVSYGNMEKAGSNRKYTFATGYNSTNATFTITNADFENCEAKYSYSRSGGGGIWTNAKTFTATGCSFTNCKSNGTGSGADNMQGGAVFHRIESLNKSDSNLGVTPYYAESQTIFTGCTFTGCVAQGSGGAMESDSTDIQLYNCTFTNCSTTKKDGAALNAYIFEKSLTQNEIPSKVYLKGCSFVGCTSGRNGGAVRSLAVDTEVVDCTFTNTKAKGADSGGVAAGGGAIYVNNNSAGTTIVRGCTFTGTSLTSNGSGGAIFTIAKQLTVENTTISNSQVPKNGGAIYHANKNAAAFTKLTGCTINGCTATQSGGGLYTNTKVVTVDGASVISDNTASTQGGGIAVNMEGATTLTITDSTISRNIASGNGGGVWLDANNDGNRNNLTLTIKGSSIDGNTSNGSGGGIYTLAKTVTIGASETRTDSEGKAIQSSVSNNTAKTNGGGIYQSRNVTGSSLTIANATINGNTANNTNTGTDQGGGGIYAGVRTLSITKSTVSNNTAKSNGGGLLFEINSDDARDAMNLTIEGCTLNGNTSNANGGGIYTKAKTVAVRSYTEGTGESAVVTQSVISNCTATWSGGGIYQSRGAAGTTLTVTDSTISGCVSNDTNTDGSTNPRGGGGIYAYIETVTVTGSTIINNSAIRQGGGIDMPWNNGSINKLIIDSSTISGNSAGYRGGGVFSQADLTLRNDTEIVSNRLTSETAANCAGVYLINNRTLYVGPENAAEGQSDTIIVRGNTTSNNVLSDLRLWDNGSENNAASVYVYCNLSNNSEIRVVNAAKAGTQFGSAQFALTNGFSDDNAVFKADSSTLYGITDRTDSTNKTIIWAGPPIAKLTDGNGRLLYIKYYEGTATYPAIFDRLDTGSSEGSTASPFSMLRMDSLTLYYKDGSTYNGTDYCIKMLVERYETPADMTLSYKEGRTVTFTTADKTTTEEDPYPFEGKAGGRATVIRDSSVSSSKPLMSVNGTLIIENIVIDGGTENGVAVSNYTRCMHIDNASCTVTLGENAVLQNGKVNGGKDGGGVYLNNGTLIIQGGIIRNCTASNDGGGVFLNNGSVTLEAGSIYECTASGSGGGVRAKNGSFTMSGGMIQGCSAKNGGGVYLPGNTNYPMYMTGGSIINNSATASGGGIAFYNGNSRLYLSGKVNISGNTCDASVATNKACNVELNQSSKSVINTYANGLYPGAYIGVYVPGDDNTNPYKDYGGERDNFGTFAENDNTTNLYSFVNDRNGLKGGIIENPTPNTIYWIKIFSLEVTKEVVSGESTTVNPDELFLFKVNVRGNATVTGQLDAVQIDSSTGDYGEMQFTSNGSETTTAVFGLVDGQTISGVNLSEGLTYEVIEYLTVDQVKRYAAMPMNGAGTTTESLEYNGVTYQVIRVNTFASAIGENKTRTDVDPYTSALTFSNLMPACKITDMSGNLLYRRYDWDKVTNKTGEGQDGGNSTNQPYYYAPAVYTELTGNDGAFKALEGTLYRSNGSNPTSYSVNNGVQIQMLIGDYSLNEAVTANTGKVTLTTASSGDTLFPKQDAGTTSTIRRAFAGGSMFSVSGDLTLATVIFDGVKGSYTVAANGGIISVENGGNLTIQDGATLQNSRTAEGYSGGAVYVASGGAVTMTGGTVNHNESVGNGAGIYLNEGSTLNLSGAPNFGGTGTNVSGNITTTNGNFKTGVLVAKLNGGKEYTLARQDIYIAGYASTSDEDTSAASLVIDGNITSGDGTIWVWAEQPPRYKALSQFAIYTTGVTNIETTLAAFRNAQDDATSGADQVGEYLYGIKKEDDTGYHVFWLGLDGFDVKFKKIDGFGNALENAVFTLYSDSECTTALEVSSTVVTGTSDNTGVVIFDNRIPIGVYYMKETTIPTGYANTNTYIVLVGDKALAKEDLDATATGYLTNISTETITGQTVLYKTAYQDTESDYDKYAVFLIDSTTSKAVTTPDIAKYGIMNTSTAERKAILRKVSNTYASLEGAVFEILRYDHTFVSSTDINGATTTSFTSGVSGVYFIDMLPFGTYYLHETTIPPGYQEVTAGNDGNWFILTVNENGVGYEQATDTGTAIRNTLSPVATKPN